MLKGFSCQIRFSIRRQVLNRALKCLLLLYVLLGPLLLGLHFFSIYPVHATPENIRVYIDPPTLQNPNLGPGEQFSIDIRTDYVENLWAYQFWLSFNPEVLQGVSVENGPFLGSAGGTVVVAPGVGFDNEVGELKLFSSSIFFMGEPPPDAELPDGGGVLATLTFDVVDYGSSPIRLGAPETRLSNKTAGWELRNNQTGDWEYCYGLIWEPYPWGGGEWVTYEPWIERLGHGYFTNVEYSLEIDSSPITGVNFTLDGQLYQTPFSESLSAGSYTVSMPSTWQIGGIEYNFLYWEDSSTNATRIIDLASDMSLTATYIESVEYSLEIDSSPITGVNFTLDGQLYQTPFSESLSAGSYTVSMPSTCEVGETEYDFLKWADGVTTPTRTIQLMSDTSLTAQYIEAVLRYTLEINSTLIDSTPIEGMAFKLDGASEIAPFSESLRAKRHVIQMPSKCEVDGTQYWFLNWLDDNSPNPIRAINLTSDTSLIAVYTNRSVHNINTDIYYESIQEAIDALETDDGHTIEVYAETYYEYVTVNKSLKLVGKDPCSIIIDGNGTAPGGTMAVIYVTADNVSIIGFTIQNSNRMGIYLDGSMDIVTGCNITDNTILDCSDGVGLFLAENNTINRNVMAVNYPMWLDSSNNNTISGNTITSGISEGLALWNSHNNVIEANTISNSGSYGIYLDGSSNNTIYHNNLLDSASQAFVSIDSLYNVWDDGYPSGGNYWSDYTGVDFYNGPYQNETGSDGIGDTPYIIDADNNDTYPLMTPKPLWFSIVWDGVTYPIRIVTNSTVTLFKFNQVGIQISFNVTGPDGTTGFCEIQIPKDLLDAAPDEWTVLVGGTPVTPQVTPETTHNILYFTYDHTTQIVQIIGTTVVDNIPPVANAERTTPRQVEEDQEEVTFDGSASWDNVAIKNYTWTFEDVTPKVLTGEIQTYTFESPGIYFVTLTVTDPRDNMDTDTVMITVLDITPPAANASETPKTVNEDTLMKLDGSASWDNVAITEYIWTFEDVTPQTLVGVGPTYTFFTPGVFTVTLNVSDAAGNWATDTVDITVLDITPPVADASKTPKTVNEDTLVTLDGSASTDNLEIESYTWTFVDVALQTWTPTPQTLVGVGPTYTFFTPGVFTVTLNVSDAAGNWATDTVDITVLDITPPVADAGPTQIVNEDTLVTLNGSASWDNDPFNVLSYDWTFLDETPQALDGVNPNYTFFTPGVFTVTLKVTDAVGLWDTDMVVIIVADVTGPVADAGSDQVVDEDTLVSFDGSGSTDNVGVESYVWAFTDGGALQVLTGETATYEFENPGVYNVILKVTDAAGNWDIDAVVVTVLDVTGPVADAGSDQVVDEDTLVSFDGSGSTDNVGVESYVWTFTEGDTSRTLTGVNPTYIFNSPDDYVVTLKVTDAAGNWATDTVTISVQPVEEESGAEGVPMWAVGVVAVAVVALAAGIIWFKRRSSRI